MGRITKILTLAQVRIKIDQERQKAQVREERLKKIDQRIANLERKKNKIRDKSPYSSGSYGSTLKVAESLGCDAIGVIDHKYTTLRKEGKWYNLIYENGDWDSPKLKEIER
jgi:hypothetical protein